VSGGRSESSTARRQTNIIYFTNKGFSSFFGIRPGSVRRRRTDEHHPRDVRSEHVSTLDRSVHSITERFTQYYTLSRAHAHAQVLHFKTYIIITAAASKVLNANARTFLRKLVYIYIYIYYYVVYACIPTHTNKHTYTHI